jgi:hypothetical protein
MVQQHCFLFQLLRESPQTQHLLFSEYYVVLRPDRPWSPPSLLYNGYRVFLGGKERPGRDADPSPPSSAVVMKG